MLIDISQDEADRLLAIEKIRADEEVREFPVLGGRISAPLVSRDGRERFFLDCHRGRILISKVTLQTRTHLSMILARLDFGGPPHQNPDGEEIASPHLHLYREGWADKWAIAPPVDKFPNIKDPLAALHAFQKYCNIVEPSRIEGSLL